MTSTTKRPKRVVNFDITFCSDTHCKLARNCDRSINRLKLENKNTLKNRNISVGSFLDKNKECILAIKGDT